MKKKEFNIKGFVFTIALIVIVFCISIILTKYFDKKKIDKIYNNNEIVKGKIVETGYRKINFVIAEYYYKNIRYTVEQSVHSNSVKEGEYFKVYLNMNNPQQSFIAYDEPFFEENQKVTFTDGRVETILERNLIRFSYTIEGKNYLRFQKVKSTLDIKVGNIYKLQYLIDTPTIAIIYIQ